MRLIDIIKKKQALLNKAPVEFLNSLNRVQLNIYGDLLERLAALKLTSDGKFAMTVKNLEIAEQINNELGLVLSGSGYLEAVTDFASDFDRTKKLNDDYFKLAFPDFENTNFQAKMFETTKLQAVELLAGSTPETEFLQGIKDLINTNVQAGSSWREAVKAIRDYAIGEGNEDGKLLQYSKQVAFDSMATSDRAYTNAVAEELEAEWYYYAGNEIETTREFCEERADKYFHYLEVESWVSLEWDGKNETTTKETIYIFAGGWNCRHSLMPTSLDQVPRDVIDRNIANGNFTPSEFEKEFLEEVA